MTNYNINKGIGKTVEFEGLKTQYIFIFAGGLLGTHPGHFNWRELSEKSRQPLLIFG